MVKKLQLVKGFYNNIIINDFNNEIIYLKYSLNFFIKLSNNKKLLILLNTDLSINNIEYFKYIIYPLISTKIINKIFIVNNNLIKSFICKENIFFCNTVSQVCDMTKINYDNNNDILLKGNDKNMIKTTNHFFCINNSNTILNINLNIIENNLQVYRDILNKKTKIMAIVKAYSYGFGDIIVNILQYCNIDYISVANTYEGVILRKNGIISPIMIMNFDINTFDSLLYYNLEPSIYNFKTLKLLISFLLKKNIHDFKIHIKFNTGMNRLGFDYKDIILLANILNKYSNLIIIKSIFSHLSSSKNISFKIITQNQIKLFSIIKNKMKLYIKYNILFHIANTTAIINYPNAQFDMVRLGIGLYGIDYTKKLDKIKFSASLQTIISQIRYVKKNQTIGYNCKGTIKRNSKIAIVKIGYADGLKTYYNNNINYMIVNNMKAPVIGNICMDMTMLDVTNIKCKEHDIVTIFDNIDTLNYIANILNISLYEIFTNISSRVNRIYHYSYK